MTVLRGQQGLHDTWVFPYNGKPVDKVSTRAWHNALKRAGIENFRWHDLRHTWASWHVMSGTPMEVLMKLGGWKSLDMVMRYAHLSSSYVAQFAENVLNPHSKKQNSYQEKLDKSLLPIENKEEFMGWLMGLEPTTTGITKRSPNPYRCKLLISKDTFSSKAA